MKHAWDIEVNIWSSGAGCSKSENIHFAGQASRFKPSKRDMISVLLANLIYAHSGYNSCQEDHTVHLGKMMRSNTKITELYLGKQRTLAFRCPTDCPACWRLIRFQNFWLVQDALYNHHQPLYQLVRMRDEGARQLVDFLLENKATIFK